MDHLGDDLRDLVALTKPRIISLLLVTTVAPMFVAGSPSWWTVLAVTVGGREAPPLGPPKDPGRAQARYHIR